MDLIALAIPGFFLLMGVEALYSKKTGRGLYRLHDSLTDLGTGIVNQVISVFTAGLLFGLYWLTWEHLRVLDLPRAWWVWVLAFAALDHSYYWFHRLSHEHNVLWVTHVVHHQSEDYNLSVALRQGAVEPLLTWVFYQPLALLGIHPLIFLTVNGINTLYQFWVHTRAIDRLGPLEAVLNTPSHHRVHHGCDPKYLDRNYGGMFIVWDKLYGTYQVEEEPPTFGVVKQLASWNPVWANLEHPVRMLRASRGRGLLGALRLWWEPPAALPVHPAEVGVAPQGVALDVPPGTRTPEGLTVRGRERYDVVVSAGRRGLALAVFVAGIAGLLLMLFAGDALDGGSKAALGLAVVLAMMGVGGVLERKAWAPLVLTAVVALGAVAALV